MKASELLRWQWEGYAKYHRSRANLLIHIFAVPLFWLGNVGLLAAFLKLSLGLGAISIVAILVALILQGRGHKMEEIPPAPFTGAANAVSRLFLEQWITFPRFVLSGGWFAALRHRGEK